MNDSNLTKGQQMVKKAVDLLEEMENDTKMFEEKTGKIVDSINSGLNELEKDVATTEEKLDELEKDTIKKVDDTIIDSLKGDD